MPAAGEVPVVGLVLAAGAGTRLGMPKALVRDAAGVSWLTRSVRTLVDGGMGSVHVVIGAQGAQVRRSVPAGCQVVEAADWEDGMGASLRAGLGAVARDHPDAAAVVVTLVDTPDVGADVVRRMTGQVGTATLSRAAYGGRPGHPVVLGRTHWAGVLEAAGGDTGARGYLTRPDVADLVAVVECGDLATGVDVDTATELGSWRRTDRTGNSPHRPLS